MLGRRSTGDNASIDGHAPHAELSGASKTTVVVRAGAPAAASVTSSVVPAAGRPARIVQVYEAAMASVVQACGALEPAAVIVGTSPAGSSARTVTLIGHGTKPGPSVAAESHLSPHPVARNASKPSKPRKRERLDKQAREERIGR